MHGRRGSGGAQAGVERPLRKVALLAIAAAALGAAAVGTAALATETIAYGYDALGRLVKVQRSGTVNNNLTTTYAHDKADNRVLKNTL